MTDRPVALITGASRGIGAATAEELARRGYDVSLMARSADALRQVARKAKQVGGEALVIPGDLFDLDHAQQAIEDTVQRFGRIDALINNAAWRDIVTMRTITLESWERTIRTSLTAPAFMARWAAVHMEKRGKGVILNVSSIQSERVSGIAPAYIAAKGALDSLTSELAALYGSRGIRVLALNPGAIDTEMSGDYESSDGLSLTQKLRKNSLDMIPLGRWGQTGEMARTIAMLISDDASYITGTTIVADGGYTTQLNPYSLKHLMFPGEFRQ